MKTKQNFQIKHDLKESNLSCSSDHDTINAYHIANIAFMDMTNDDINILLQLEDDIKIISACEAVIPFHLIHD